MVKRIIADAFSRPVRIAKGNTATIRGIHALDARIQHVKNAERYTAPLIPSTAVRDRVLRTRIILCFIAVIAKRSTNRLKRIHVVACIRSVSTAKVSIAITLGTPVPDAHM